MKDLVHFIMSEIAEFPDKVAITEKEDDRGVTVFELRVAESDLGRVIGKQGRTAKAVRTLLQASGIKNGKRYGLEIIED